MLRRIAYRTWPWRLVAVLLLAAVALAPGGPADPEPVADASWIRAVGRQRQALARDNVDLCFVGDSLTEFWTATGKPVWDLEFHDRACVNLGLAGDRTEHILHRLSRLEFARSKPKTIIVLAGTNNLSKDPPDTPADVVQGVIRIVDTLKRKSPASRILVLSILPNGFEPESPLRTAIVETNRLLGDKFAAKADPDVDFLDVHDAFLNDKGTWKNGLTLDGTHLSLAGYDRLAHQLAPALKGQRADDPAPPP